MRENPNFGSEQMTKWDFHINVGQTLVSKFSILGSLQIVYSIIIISIKVVTFMFFSIKVVTFSLYI